MYVCMYVCLCVCVYMYVYICICIDNIISMKQICAVSECKIKPAGLAAVLT